jgi:isopentenyl diphosphate isomerase/L-lactate dehydrogenase-like FMN-dependent dehydrogenase
MKTARAIGRVFISHSHRDDELVRDLARRLRNAGLEPIVTFADVPEGADWKHTVREHIRAADAMLILVTPAALSSPWMMTELGLAEGFERPILPVTAGVKPRDLPAPLRSSSVAPFDEADDAISRLSKKLTTSSEERT